MADGLMAAAPKRDIEAEAWTAVKTAMLAKAEETLAACEGKSGNEQWHTANAATQQFVNRIDFTPDGTQLPAYDNPNYVRPGGRHEASNPRSIVEAGVAEGRNQLSDHPEKLFSHAKADNFNDRVEAYAAAEMRRVNEAPDRHAALEEFRDKLRGELGIEQGKSGPSQDGTDKGAASITAIAAKRTPNKDNGGQEASGGSSTLTPAEAALKESLASGGMTVSGKAQGDQANDNGGQQTEASNADRAKEAGGRFRERCTNACGRMMDAAKSVCHSAHMAADNMQDKIAGLAAGITGTAPVMGTGRGGGISR